MGEGPSRLRLLEARLRKAAKVERFLTPSIDTYQSLLSSGWNINSAGADRENALTASVRANDAAVVRFLLERGGRATNRAFLSALHTSDPAIIRMLLASVRSEVRATVLGSLLVEAPRVGLDATRFLLSEGAPINWRDPVTGRTALIAAVSAGALDTARLLLSSGANIHPTDEWGRGAFWYAAGAYNTGFITMLAARGADVNQSDTSGTTPIKHASDLCAEWNIGPLLAAGADPRIPDKAGQTALTPSTGVIGDPKCERTLRLLQ
jgi:ankyrin repeat protein